MVYTANFDNRESIIVKKNVSRVAAELALILRNGLSVSNPKHCYSVALSGGSTPISIFRHLARYYRRTIDWGRICFYWVDERCVPPDHPDSNYGMAFETLLSKVGTKSSGIFRMQGEKDPEAEALRYHNLLMHNLSGGGQWPVFDLILLGIGDDGHTASIFPGDSKLFSGNFAASVAVHPKNLQKRISLTGSTINSARQIVFVVTGRSKAAILQRLNELPTPDITIPASLIQPVNGKMSWLLDEEASEKLKLID